MKIPEPALLSRLLCGLLLAVVTQAIALEDPTRPPGAGSILSQERPLPSLSLESILISANRRVAVINGHASVEGQVIDGVRIRKIFSDRVEVIYDGRVRVLHLNKLPQVRGPQ
ncbi:MAG TPA: hypothetical protein VL091_11175 [Marinobacter sp.]|nr:hypothetical protein [Marinobacter sp.]